MKMICRESGQEFQISNAELQYYYHFQVPIPTISPDERHRRRLAFRNERNYYKRPCDGTGAEFVSLFPPDYQGVVYSPNYWWSDNWEAKDHAKEFSFERPFFDQFAELLLSVPQLGIVVINSENCDYNSPCTGARNCYLCQRIADSENIYYSYLVVDSRDCGDCYNISKSELCYEVIDGENCYAVCFSQNVSNCKFSSFLFNCKNCSYCFLSSNLRNAKYVFKNECLSKSAYEKRIEEYNNLTLQKRNILLDKFQNMLRKTIVPALWGSMNENVTGNYIFQSKNVHNSFDVFGGEDVYNAWGHIYGKNCLDVDFTFHCDEAYETASVTHSSNLKYCYGVFNHSRDIEYSMNCTNNCHDLFGCAGMKHAEYCILNRQYLKDDYESLRLQIINYMKSTHEWGEYFPMKLSPFAYNETVAHEYFPLSKAEVLSRGLKWRDWEAKHDAKTIKGTTIANDANLLKCISCENFYKLQKLEIEFYKKMGLPFTEFCPDCRYIRRLNSRSGRKLFSRACTKCTKQIVTAYAETNFTQVYCEECYLSLFEH
jgi:hypothetical protein